MENEHSTTVPPKLLNLAGTGEEARGKRGHADKAAAASPGGGGPDPASARGDIGKSLLHPSLQILDLKQGSPPAGAAPKKRGTNAKRRISTGNISAVPLVNVYSPPAWHYHAMDEAPTDDLINCLPKRILKFLLMVYCRLKILQEAGRYGGRQALLETAQPGIDAAYKQLHENDHHADVDAPQPNANTSHRIRESLDLSKALASAAAPVLVNAIPFK